MNKQKPYETELANKLQEVPLPDIELAWNDMEERLGNKKKRRFIPFFLFKTGIAIGLVAAVSGVAIWMHNETDNNKQQSFNKQTQSKLSAAKTNEKQPHSSTTSTLTVSKNAADKQEQQITQQQKQIISAQQKNNDGNNVIASIKDNNILQKNTVHIKASVAQQRAVTQLSIYQQKPKTKKLLKQKNDNVFEANIGNTVDAENSIKLNQVHPKDISVADSNQFSKSYMQSSIGLEKESTAKDTLTTVLNSAKDSSIVTSQTLAKPADSLKPKSANKKIRLSAGLAFYQQIPVDGQVFAAYNFNGNNAVLTDYIPALHLRMHFKKWFAEAGFRFAAPLWTNQQEYFRKTVYLNTTKTVVTNSLQLKKIYYHQLPVSVNYQLNNQFSIGTGLSWNYLYSNVTERTTTTQNILTGTYTSETSIAATKRFTDSFFYSNHVNLMLQTEYRYKRFGFMLRYSKGLQPYMQFVNAAGEMQQLSQQSLEFIFNIRLWKNFKP